MPKKPLDYKAIIVKHIEEDNRRFEEIKDLLYGNEDKGEIGMKQKLDEIHELLIQAKGLKKFANIIILFAGLIGAWTAIKVFFIK